MSETKILRCANCGAPLPLKAREMTVVCRFCGHSADVSKPVWNPWDGYVKAVLSTFQVALSSWSQASAPRPNQELLKNAPKRLLVLQAVPIVLMLLAAASAGSAGSGQVLFAVVMLGFLALWVFAMVGNQRTFGQKAGSSIAPDVTVAVVCSSCRATQELPIDGTTTTCRNCGAALLPTDDDVERTPATGAVVVLRERLRQWSAERAGWAFFLAYAGVFTSNLILVAGFVLSAILLGLSAVALASLGKKEIWDTLALFLLAVLAGLATAYGALVRRRLSRAWRASIRALVTEHGGAPVAASTWLDAHWAGPVTHEILYGDWAYHALAFHVGGYEALLVTNTASIKGQQARIMVLLAAWTPGVSERADALPAASRLQAPAAGALRARIASYGFKVDLEAAGIIASAHLDRVAHIGAHPESAVELAQVVRSVAQLALAIRAQPITEVLLGNVAPNTPDRPVGESLPRDGDPPIRDERQQEAESERKRRLLLRVADRPAFKSSSYKEAGLIGGSGVLLIVFKAALGLGGRVINSTHWAIVWWLSLTGVVVAGFWVLGRSSSYASKVTSTLGQFPKLDDGRLVALVLKEVEPIDWFDAHWQGPALDAISGAVPSGAVRWVLTGNVHDLPVMLVCLLHEPKPSDSTDELHLFVACPHSERCNREIAAYKNMVALGCKVQTPWSGVYVSRETLKPVLSVEQLSSLCRNAVELARA